MGADRIGCQKANIHYVQQLLAAHETSSEPCSTPKESTLCLKTNDQLWHVRQSATSGSKF
ncbi:hypothetical protein KIN20_014937 [Parelaphostrongylus tenuis]|uniref:Uncharacterized protein n=1 Tax=Parelaphostrongylus tenuis TaxID=148309 RepID=A0AAD5MHN6_PARTN|nr:hypothetical protein KIN20_014937 [Parelaphostrongylus tenuis]